MCIIFWVEGTSLQKNIFAPFNLDPVIWDLGGDKTKLCACNPLFCCILTVINCSSNDLARRTKWGQVYVEGIICPPPHGTGCWIRVKVAVLWARQCMSWNIFLIKVLNNFWYFEHWILTMICWEAYLKHDWRNCLWKK